MNENQTKIGKLACDAKVSAWAKAGEDVPWIGIEQERVEILPGQD
jgi:hypothetical protein